MTNAEKLKALRLGAEWTQQKTAEALHVNKRTVQRWESGDRHCPDAIVMLLERLINEDSKEA